MHAAIQHVVLVRVAPSQICQLTTFPGFEELMVEETGIVSSDFKKVFLNSQVP